MQAASPVVFYDGKCPLCRREIEHYRRLRGAEQLIWIDITRDDAVLASHGLQRETAMARLHVLDTAGQWRTGAWGFVELWSHLPAYRWLARILSMFRLVPALDWLYTRFARWRLQQRCVAGSCNSK